MFAFVAFTIVREHGGRFLSSGMSLWRMRRPRAYIVFALYSKLSWRGVAWRSSCVAFLLVLPQFWLAWFLSSSSIAFSLGSVKNFFFFPVEVVFRYRCSSLFLLWFVLCWRVFGCRL